MRKLLIAVLAIQSLSPLILAGAQAPRSNMELKAIKAEGGDEASVREVRDGGHNHSLWQLGILTRRSQRFPTI
jgi:hypothetical protein